jgi:hypothetical protein
VVGDRRYNRLACSVRAQPCVSKNDQGSGDSKWRPSMSTQKVSAHAARIASRMAVLAMRQPGVPSMIDSLEVKVLYPTGWR